MISSNNVFSSEELKRIVKETIPNEVSDNHQVAIVGLVNNEGIKVAAVFKKNVNWQFEGAYEHNWSGDNKVGGRVIFSR